MECSKTMMIINAKCEEIDSSMIKHMYYFGSENSGHVGVVFNSNYSYIYQDVEFNIFMTVVKSQSVGQSFHNLIKNNYDYYPSGNYDGQSPLEKMNVVKA